MEEMKIAFHNEGLSVPPGSISLILSGKNRREIFRKLWAAAKFGSGLGGEKATFVFPAVVRMAIREQFPDDVAAQYDYQYENDDKVYYVSIAEMAVMPYPKVKGTK